MAEPLAKTFGLWKAKKTKERSGPVDPPHEREPLPLHKRRPRFIPPPLHGDTRGISWMVPGGRQTRGK